MFTINLGQRLDLDLLNSDNVDTKKNGFSLQMNLDSQKVLLLFTLY